MRGRIVFVIVAVGAFVLDRVLKVLVRDRLAVGEHHTILGDDLLVLRHVHNPGIAFGWLSGAGGLVVVGSLVVGLLLFVFMLRVDPSDYLTIVGGGLITGGALGNLVDRVQLRYVTDYISVPNFPTFNFADASITVGVVLVLLSQLREIVRERGESA